MRTGIDILLQLQNIRLDAPAIVDIFFETVSNPLVYELPILIVAFIHLWFIDKDDGRLILTTMLTAICLTNIVKCIVKEPRPWVIDNNIHPSETAMEGAKGYSFPSGHSTVSVSGYGQMLSLTGNRYLRIGIIVFISSIVFSRLYLGVHTPLDVIVGVTIGIVMIIANLYLSRISERDDRTFYAVQMMYVMFAIATIICISIVDTISRSQAVMVGALLGVALGSMVEHRYVGHIPSGFTRKGACACIISVVIMASIFAIGYLMPIIVSSISAAMVMVMAVAFVPYILKRCSDHVE